MRQLGFILLTVLIFLQVFSLLSLYALTLASTHLKANDHLWHGYLYRQKSYGILQQLEADLARDRGQCSIPVTPAPELAQKALPWWQLNTCSANVAGIRYYYAVEFLGDDSCAMLNETFAGYYRVTLYLLPDKLLGAKYLLQSTIALPSLEAGDCREKPHKVQPGRQMWRQIYH